MTQQPSGKKTGFWKKQFSSDVTERQIVFDFLFGAVLPWLCIIFDPFVFKGNVLLRSPLVDYRIFAYVGITLGTITLISWLFEFGPQIGSKWAGFFSGIMLFGALFAIAGGLVLLPFSATGLLLFGLGLLGFIPFVTGFVFLRNGLRALGHKEQMQSISEKRFFWGSAFLGLAMIIAIPTFAQWQTSKIVSRGVQLVLSGNGAATEKGVQSLKKAFWCDYSCYEKIVDAYIKEEDETRRATLAKAYREITGQDINNIVEGMFGY